MKKERLWRRDLMEPEDALGRILDTITKFGQLRGLKGIAQLEEAAAMYRGFLRKARYYKRLEFSQLARLLERLAVEPTEFFERTFWDSWLRVDPVRDFGFLCDLQLRKHSDGEELWSGEWDSEERCSKEWIEPLDAAGRLCYSAPRKATRQAKKLYEAAIEHRHLDLAVRAASVWSSALRFSGQLDRAQVLLWRAIKVARQRLLDREWRMLYADLLRRGTHIAIELAHHTLALRLAEQAMTESGLAGDPAGIGRGLVSRGTAAAMSEDRSTALESFLAALNIFEQHPEPDPVYHLAAWFALAVETFEDGQFEKADEYFRYLSEAFPDLEANPHILGRLHWYRGRLAHRQESYVEAETCYEEAFEILNSFVVDAAMVCMEAILIADEREDRRSRRKWIHHLRDLSFRLSDKDQRLDQAIERVVRESRFQKLSKETVDSIKAEFKQRWT